MRSLLTSGIKAILAIAALSTAAHWTFRLQREPDGSPRPLLASLADPDATGSIAPRRVEAPQAAVPAPAPMPPQDTLKSALKPAEAARPAAAGRDQSHLAALIAGTTTAAAKPRAKVAKR
jgi:hypothetical protein